MNRILKLIISIAIPITVGAIAGFFTSSSVNTWYATLNKPTFNPPSWVFGPAWTTLYILMGIAFYLVWKSASRTELKQKAILFYFVQLVFNFAWSFIFFYAQQPGWALVEICFLWLFILITLFYFSKISSTAAWLLVPYACWVTFAAVLNYFIWYLN